jgi:hypothetical protein
MVCHGSYSIGYFILIRAVTQRPQKFEASGLTPSNIATLQAFIYVTRGPHGYADMNISIDIF